MNKKTNFNLFSNNHNSDITECTQRLIIIIVFILIILLIWKQNKLLYYNFFKYKKSYFDYIISFLILFFFILIITRNIKYSLTSTIIIYLIYGLLFLFSEKNKYSYYQIENFQNDTSSETNESSDSEKKKVTTNDLQNALKNIDLNIVNYQNDKDVKNASEGINDLLKKLNGGISLTKKDLEETKPLNVDTTKYKDESKNNALQKAQQETYQLIDSVSALKDTLTTLSPILSQGKDIMSLFENLKF